MRYFQDFSGWSWLIARTPCRSSVPTPHHIVRRLVDDLSADGSTGSTAAPFCESSLVCSPALGVESVDKRSLPNTPTKSLADGCLSNGIADEAGADLACWNLAKLFSSCSYSCVKRVWSLIRRLYCLMACGGFFFQASNCSLSGLHICVQLEFASVTFAVYWLSRATFL